MTTEPPRRIGARGPVSAETDATPEARDQPAWLTRGVRGIGVASLLSDLGHEVPTSLLPSLLTSTLHAPASALGVIEGVADGLAGAANFAGGAPADDPARRRSIAVGGYASTAVPPARSAPLAARGKSGSSAPAPGPPAGYAFPPATRCSPTWSPPPPTAAPTASTARWTTSARSAAHCSPSRSSG